MGVIKVETFDVNVSGTQTHSLTNTLPSLSSGFVRNTNSKNHSAGPIGVTLDQGPNGMSGYAYVSSTNELILGSQTGTVKMMGEVWSYTGAPGGPDEFIVRDRLQVTITDAGPSTGNVVNGVVNPNRCVCFITGKLCTQTDRSNTSQMGAIAYLETDGTLTVVRGVGGSDLTVFVTVVEFTGTNWLVAYSKTLFSTGAKTLYLGCDGVSGAVPVLDWNNSFFVEVSQSGGNGTHNAIEDTNFLCEPNDPSSFLQTIDPTASNLGEGFVYVLNHPLLTVARESASKSILNNNTYVSETFPPITLTNLDESCVEWMVYTDGGGTAHGRGALSAILTSTTTLESWVHRSGNAGTYRYGAVDLSELQNTAQQVILGGPVQVEEGLTGLTINGIAFGGIQGTGAVYLSDNETLGLGTEVLQSVTSWSDDTIVFDANATGLPDGVLYIIVVNDEGVSSSQPTRKGIPSYSEVITDKTPDHWWTFDNTLDDFGSYGGSPFTLISSGANAFEPVPISEDTTHSWNPNGGYRTSPNSPKINSVATFNRLMGGWIRPETIYKSLSCIYEEGGSLNNLAVLIGMGNKLIANYADTGDDNAQAFSDFSLEPGRPYHIMFRFSHTEAIKEFTLWIDGKKQTVTTGNPLTSGDLDGHGGSISIGGSTDSLEVGGTDISFTNVTSMLYSNWASWSDPTQEADIYELFSRGAIPEYLIAADTATNMQLSLDAIASTSLPNSAMSIRVDVPTDGLDLILVADNITFSPLTSIHLEWRSAGTLTWVNLNGSNLDHSKVSAPRNGVVNIQTPSILTLSGLQPNTEVRVFEAGTSNEIGGVENSGTTFSLSVQVSSVDITIVSIQYENIRLNNVNTSSNISLPIQQTLDRNYKNP